MFKYILLKYEAIVYKWFGYEALVRSEDGIILVGGIFIGILIMAVISGFFIFRLYKVEDAGRSKVKMIRVDKGYKSKFIVSFNTVFEAIQQVLLLSFSPFFTIKRFTERDEKRTKRFLIIMFTVAIFVLCLTITSIVTVIDITHMPRWFFKEQ